MPTLEGRDVFGAKLHLYLLEFALFDTVLPDGVDNRVKGVERLIRAIFRLMQHTRDQQCGSVVIE